jgi:membrane-associated phospholipid phosphatase
LADRDSAGGVLASWFNLQAVYHIKTSVARSHSFPSDHALATFFFTLAAFRQGYRKSGVLLAGLLVFLAITRIMAGAHWPTDILGALPFAALLVGVAYETRFVYLKRWLEMFLNGVWHAVLHRGEYSLPARVENAWKVFLSGEK